MLTDTYQSFTTVTQSYYNNLPRNIGENMLYSSVIAFVAGTIIDGSPKLGLAAAAISTTAVGIHALVTPLFKKVLNKPYLSWGEEMCRGGLALIGSSCIAVALGNTKAFDYLFIRAVFYGFRASCSDRDINQSTWFTIIV